MSERSGNTTTSKGKECPSSKRHPAESDKQSAEQAQTRRLLVGSGDRSERIRTYNFPQGRLTDHRINLTLYKLLTIMEGDLDDVVTALQVARGAEQLNELEAANNGS